MLYFLHIIENQLLMAGIWIFSCHPISVKKGTLKSLVDSVFKMSSPMYIDSEVLYLRDTLFCNEYRVKFKWNNKEKAD